jgi:hypothetical protein
MAGARDKRVGRRFGRRSALLVALGLVSSLGAAGALAAISTSRSVPSRDENLAVRVAPASVTIIAGATATYMLRVARDHRGTIGLSGRTSLTMRRAGMPDASEAYFSNSSAVGGDLHPSARTALTITTTAETPPGTYDMRLGVRRAQRRGSAVVELVVSAPAAIVPGRPDSPAEVAPSVPQVPSVLPVQPDPPVPAPPDAFTISGALPHLLTPGTGEPLDLTLTNLESTDLTITNLNVEVASVSGPQSSSTHTCDPGDFSIEQFSGVPGFTLSAASSADLGELGFAPSEWPTVSMLDRPVNQDGCKGASLSLSFTGTADGVTP